MSWAQNHHNYIKIYNNTIENYSVSFNVVLMHESYYGLSCYFACPLTQNGIEEKIQTNFPFVYF